MSPRLCPGGFAFALREISNKMSLGNLVNFSTGTIGFSAQCSIGLSVMVFAKLPTIPFVLRADHEKRIQSHPFISLYLRSMFHFVNASSFVNSSLFTE